MPVFTDLLDGTAGQSLENRPGWSKTTGADVAALADGGSGFCLPGGTTTASGTWHAPTSQPASADQYCEGILRLANSALSCPLGVRCDTSAAAGQGYLVQLDNSTGRLRLLRRSSAGALTTLGTFSVPTPADLDSNKVRLQAVGTAISVLFMGAAVIGPVADAQIASGSVAMLSRGGSLISTAVARIDNWESGEVSTGPAPITGTGSASFAAMTGTGAGALAIAAQGAGTFAPMTGTGSGALAIRGAGSGTFAPMTGTGAGALAIEAQGAGTFAPMTGAATGTITAAPPIEASASATFAPMTGTARGRIGRITPVRFLSFRVEPKALSFSVEAKRLNFTVDAEDTRTVEAMGNKIVSEVWVCGLDLTPWKAGGREVIAVRHEPVAGAIDVDDVALVDADNATFTVSGGTRKGTSQFDIVGDMSDGGKFGQRFQVTCI